jgi:membrane-bound lytic murein transglycosylase MltF
MSHALTRRFADDLVRYADSVELTVLPAPRVERIMPTAFGHADELIAGGLSLARTTLARTDRVVPLRRAA